jgi:DivIVA domain-containing protein
MPEDRVTISSTARLHPDEVARRTFATTRRGFDPGEVRSFLEAVAREMVAAADREHEMRRAVAEADQRAANPVLDDATLDAALGQETARVLRSAHDAAAELIARAEIEATRLRAQAEEEAEQLQRRVEQSTTERAAQSDAAATEMRRRAQEEATARVESAKAEADTLMGQARTECRAMVQEAQELRTRVLADLARRRRVLHSQIEQLRAGRERLAETIGDVRQAVDNITDELFRAEDEARLAAEAAGRQAAQEELAEVTAAEALRVDGVIDDLAAVEETDSQQRQSVDELFARLRAEAGVLGDPAVAPDGTDVATSSPSEPGVAGPAPSPAPSGADQAVAGRAPDQRSEAPRTGEPGPRRSPARVATTPRPDAAPKTPMVKVIDADAPAPDASAEGGSEDADDGAKAVDPIIAQRDEVLTPVVAGLARRLKRALQDDQNDILDRLRAKGGWAPGVLPSEEEHAQRYLAAISDQLMEAARAGATFGGGKADDAPGVDDVAGDLASRIITPMRRRLDGEGPSVEAGDEPALVELVGAAFREWKGARTERLAADQAVLAFSRAALKAAPRGAALRWVVNDDAAECPDCDDNALAGPVPAGDVYPTGHPHPPAHAGCRCLLTPANA